MTAIRFVTRLFGAIAVSGFLVMAGVELSISGGFKAVMLPLGINENSPRDLAIAETYNLRDGFWMRYLRWLWEMLGGDLGTSSRSGLPVTDMIVPRLSISGELMLVAVIGAVALAIPLGLLAAAKAETPAGRAIDALLGISQTVPVFITPYFLMWVFALKLQWLPASGWVRLTNSFGLHLQHLALPAATLIFAEFGRIGRTVRADTVEVLKSDFITAAASKGLSTRYLLLRHALRPASLGSLNVIGMSIGSLLSGAVIVELVFGIGGLGMLLLEASLSRDLYLLLGLTTYMVVIYVCLSAVVDVAMRWADPRITVARRPRMAERLSRFGLRPAT